MFYMLPSFNLVNQSSTLGILLLLVHLSSSQNCITFAIHINTLPPLPSPNFLQRIMGQTISATQFFVYGKRHFTQYVA